MDDTSKIKKKIFGAYISILTVVSLGLGVSLYKNWCSLLEDTASTLLDEAAVKSALIEGSLLDASRILDVAKGSMAIATSSNTISNLSAHNILNKSLEGFSMYEPENSLGLLFYVDKNGIIRAENGIYPTSEVDVNDRLYFRELSQHPNLKWYIGNKVLGRRTGSAVFHLAIPLLDPQNRFNGLLVQQISVDAISKALASATGHNKFRTLTYQDDGYLIYAHPDDPLAENSDVNAQIQSSAKAQDKKTGWFYLATPKHYAELGVYVGFVHSSVFGLLTVTTIPRATLLKKFAFENMQLSLYIVMGLLIISVVFYNLYKQVCANAIATELALHDPLTHLQNRRALDEEFPRLWHDAMRQNKPISALFADIDHFKVFNDTCGHDLGDEALKAVANTISQCCKRPLDFCCRWGGEEFAIILPETDEAGAIHIAKELLKAVSEIRIAFPEPCPLTLGISIGIATVNVSATTIDEDLVNMADKAMLEAKRTGRGRYVLYRDIQRI